MTSSGSVNFTMNELEIIELGFEIAGIKGIGRVLSAEDYARGRRLLNLIVKQWMGKADFAPGLKIWTRKRGTLFPALDEREYLLGPNGDHATSSYRQSTLAGAEAIGQTVLSMTATTGMVNGDYIGIRCEDGSIHWSTISSFVAATSVTIPDALTVAAAIGATVYWYTTKLLMPLSVLSLRRKNTTASEQPLNPMSLSYYDSLPDKTASGTPAAYLYERGVTDGTVRFDYGVSDTSDVYDVTFLRQVEDFDAATDTPDYPQEWYRPLVAQLAIDAATSQGLPVTEDMRTQLTMALAMAQSVDAENSDGEVFFQAED